MQDKTKKIHVSLWKDQIIAIEKIAKKRRGISNSQVVRELLEIGLRTKLKDLYEKPSR